VNFLADSMLGKLARWLRMLGSDVTYDVKLDDLKLLELAKSEKRALLTKDLELYQRAVGKGIDAYFVEGKSEAERLAELAKRYGITLEIDMDKSHCPVCNTQLKATLKEGLIGELEKNKFTYYDKFWKCTNCGQVFWQGAHWKQISYTLCEAQKKLELLKEKSLGLA
jgi:uncharacterized protein with PIN domain